MGIRAYNEKRVSSHVSRETVNANEGRSPKVVSMTGAGRIKCHCFPNIVHTLLNHIK
ncbi:hypothetical protein DPMN_109288 [Dreissena polymorpha]|uniref:Uncharacterized protein n=1 Tax=Dreissena polymorpha TaxID=45954 RepID=A0A9D4QM06_DREPO|nr:hypothetical protein DPMN_109288 [Dreissena polymorpha]